MIPCYLNKHDVDKGGFVRGFPVLKKKQHEDAIEWAGTEKYIMLPDELIGVRIYNYENKIFKVLYFTDDNKYSILFNMYASDVLDVMLSSSIIEGVIQGNLVFLGWGRLVLKGGITHEFWLKRQKEKRSHLKKH